MRLALTTDQEAALASPLIPLALLTLALLLLPACTVTRAAEETPAPAAGGHVHRALHAEPRWSRVR